MSRKLQDFEIEKIIGGWCESEDEFEENDYEVPEFVPFEITRPSEETQTEIDILYEFTIDQASTSKVQHRDLKSEYNELKQRYITHFIFGLLFFLYIL